MEDLRFPIGRFSAPRPVTFDHVRGAIDSIERCPSDLRASLRGLNAEQLETPYREGGWTVRQVVHHLPDSHMNAYTRMKLAYTENHPAIKPYEEAQWAELVDGRTAPVDVSLSLLDAVHARWVMFLRSMKEKDFDRQLYHPENGDMTLSLVALNYEWHGQHHIAHITSLRKRSGW
jgi:hypothetical protein